MDMVRNLRRQHGDLVELAGEIGSRLESGSFFTDRSCRKDLSFFEGKMKIHLVMEDRHLYPLLLGHEDARLRAAAEEYRREMAGLYDEFQSILTALNDDRSGGLGAGEEERLQGVLEKMRARIEFEETSLFPLLEKA